MHAGLNPRRELGRQQVQDVLWIHADWVFSDRPHPFPYVVVYGHSITLGWVPAYLRGTGQADRLREWYGQARQPGGGFVFREADRICVDTGAATGLPGTVTVYDLTNDVQYRV